MQQVKGKKIISELPNYSTSIILMSFTSLLGQLDLRYINKLFINSKTKGISGNKVFQALFTYRFLDFSNIFQLMQVGISKELGFEKDVLYAFMKNSRINWRKIVHLFFRQVTSLIDAHTDGSSKMAHRYFIVDDTQLDKSGKTIELIGKVFDHCTHQYTLGMKMLVLGIWEGKTFLPIDFSFHNEPTKTNKRGMKEKELRLQFTKQRNTTDASYARIEEVEANKIENALKMIRQALKKNILADYVLADSWFICETFIKDILSMNGSKLHVIGLMKTNRKITLHEKEIMANKIPEVKQKDIRTSKKLKCRYITFNILYKGIPMKAYWICMKGQHSWKMLISTDTKLTFIDAMKHYQVRWTIEVFFKDCKQKLHLNACQSTDLDAHIATVSIVFMNYMVLAMRKRFDDYETLGGLFTDIKEIIIEDILIKKIWNIFIDAYMLIFSPMGIEWEIFITNLIQNKDELNELILQNFDIFFKLNKNVA